MTRRCTVCRTPLDEPATGRRRQYRLRFGGADNVAPFASAVVAFRNPLARYERAA